MKTLLTTFVLLSTITTSWQHPFVTEDCEDSKFMSSHHHQYLPTMFTSSLLSGCQTLNGVAYQGEDIPGSQLTGDNNITDVEDCRSIELETKPGNTITFRSVPRFLTLCAGRSAGGSRAPPSSPLRRRREVACAGRPRERVTRSMARYQG